MQAFMYENTWLTVSFWVVIATAATFTLLVISGKGLDNKSWRIAGGIFTVSAIAMTVFMFAATDKNALTETYKNDVTNHIKTVGQFDTVDGDLNLQPGETTVYKITVNEIPGDCIATYPTEPNGELTFGCGADNIPLEETKATFTQTLEEILKGEPANDAEPANDTETAVAP